MNRATLLNLLERVAGTFGAAFLALWLPSLSAVLAGGHDWHAVIALSVLQKAALAGVAAVLTLVKSIFATQVGNPNSGGFLPAWLLKLLGAVESKPADVHAAIAENNEAITAALAKNDTTK